MKYGVSKVFYTMNNLSPNDIVVGDNMDNDIIRDIDLIRIEVDDVFSRAEVRDAVADEVLVDIDLGEEYIKDFSTSPYLLEELGLGIAITRGYSIGYARIDIADRTITIRGITKIDIRSDRIDYSKKLSIYMIPKMVRESMEKAHRFQKTGCFHFASAFTFDGNIINIVEDISRTGALYKLIGLLAKEKICFNDIVLVMSSRVNEELMRSIANCGITIAIFRGAPTLGAIRVAKKFNRTLIAFAKTDRFNIYCGYERISFS